MIAFKTLLASKPGSRYQPFFLKIDIEGAEKTLFDSDPSCINQFPIIAMRAPRPASSRRGVIPLILPFPRCRPRESCVAHQNVVSIALLEQEPMSSSNFGAASPRANEQHVDFALEI